MRFVFTSPNFGAPHLERHRVLDGIARHLCDRGHEVHIVSFRRTTEGDDLPYDVVGPTAEGAPVGPRLGKMMEGWDPDVVVAHELRNDLTRDAVRWSLRSGTRVAVQPHGDQNAWRPTGDRVMEWKTRAYDRWRSKDLLDPRVTFIAASLQEERELAEAYGAPRVVRLYPGSDLTSHPRLRAIRDPPHALMVATFGPLRDPRWALDACRLARDGGTSVNLLFAGVREDGGGLKEETVEEAAYLGPVHVPRQSVVYEEADLCLFPSRYENFGLPVLEAAVVGLPVVTTPFGIAAELGFEEGAGALASGPEPDLLAPALVDLLRRLDDAHGQAGLRGSALRAWADWGVRGEEYRAWIEGGSVTPEPPPRPVEW